MVLKLVEVSETHNRMETKTNHIDHYVRRFCWVSFRCWNSLSFVVSQVVFIVTVWHGRHGISMSHFIHFMSSIGQHWGWRLGWETLQIWRCIYLHDRSRIKKNDWWKASSKVRFMHLSSEWISTVVFETDLGATRNLWYRSDHFVLCIPSSQCLCGLELYPRSTGAWRRIFFGRSSTDWRDQYIGSMRMALAKESQDFKAW